MALNPYERTDTGVVARPTGFGRFQAEIEVRGGTLLVDEPVEVGGGGTGPTPYELLSAALAACTAMTLRLYAERKGWDPPAVAVEVAHSIVPGQSGAPPRDHFARHIAFEGALDDERRAKLVEIADKCPLHRTLLRGFTISTSVGSTAAPPAGEPALHAREMEKACAD